MSLDDKTIALAFPFLDENGVELELNAVNLLRLPSSQSKEVIVERTASVGTDVEVPAMLLYSLTISFEQEPQSTLNRFTRIPLDSRREKNLLCVSA